MHMVFTRIWQNSIDFEATFFHQNWVIKRVRKSILYRKLQVILTVLFSKPSKHSRGFASAGMFMVWVLALYIVFAAGIPVAAKMWPHRQQAKHKHKKRHGALAQPEWTEPPAVATIDSLSMLVLLVFFPTCWLSATFNNWSCTIIATWKIQRKMPRPMASVASHVCNRGHGGLLMNGAFPFTQNDLCKSQWVSRFRGSRTASPPQLVLMNFGLVIYAVQTVALFGMMSVTCRWWWMGSTRVFSEPFTRTIILHTLNNESRLSQELWKGLTYCWLSVTFCILLLRLFIFCIFQPL